MSGPGLRAKDRFLDRVYMCVHFFESGYVSDPSLISNLMSAQRFKLEKHVNPRVAKRLQRPGCSFLLMFFVGIHGSQERTKQVDIFLLHIPICAPPYGPGYIPLHKKEALP